MAHDNRNAANTDRDYVIVRTRYFYGPEEQVSLLSDDLRNDVKRFATADAAQAYIDRYDNGRYYLAHNESGRPDYAVAHVDDLDEYLTEQL